MPFQRLGNTLQLGVKELLFEFGIDVECKTHRVAFGKDPGRAIPVHFSRGAQVPKLTEDLSPPAHIVEGATGLTEPDFFHRIVGLIPSSVSKRARSKK